MNHSFDEMIFTMMLLPVVASSRGSWAYLAVTPLTLFLNLMMSLVQPIFKTTSLYLGTTQCKPLCMKPLCSCWSVSRQWGICVWVKSTPTSRPKLLC